METSVRRHFNAVEALRSVTTLITISGKFQITTEKRSFSKKVKTKEAICHLHFLSVFRLALPDVTPRKRVHLASRRYVYEFPFVQEGVMHSPETRSMPRGKG